MVTTPQHIRDSLADHTRLVQVAAAADEVRAATKQYYSLILHTARDELGLTNNEYLLADAIHRLSKNGAGWCRVSKENLGAIVGVSRSSIHRMLRGLIKENLVEVHDETRSLRTTSKWYQAVESLRKKMFTEND